MSRNMMDIDRYKAVISYDPEIEMFRGELIGLNGGADFYASDVKGLRKEAALSLRVFLRNARQRESSRARTIRAGSSCA